MEILKARSRHVRHPSMSMSASLSRMRRTMAFSRTVRADFTDLNSFLFRNLVHLRSMRVSSMDGTTRVEARYTAGAYMTPR